jgi:hypothetical protein
MKWFKLLAAVALAHVASSLSHAQAPTTIGDSFLSFRYDTSNLGLTGTGVFYFGTDGTFRQLALYIDNPGIGDSLYDTSHTGTYTYTPSASDPNQATLTLSVAQPTLYQGYYMTVEYSGPTTGTISYAPQGQYGPMYYAQGTFSQLIHLQNNFLVNVSNRVTLRTGDAAISGFVVQGGGTRLVLVRVVGPSLAQFGVSPLSGSPQLGVFQGTGTLQIATGQKWDSGSMNTQGYDAEAMSWIFSMVGAFPLVSGSNDVAFFGVMSPGVYTAQASDSKVTAAGGSALTEVYILPYSG